MLDRLKLVSVIERDRRAVTRSATVVIYDMMLHYLGHQAGTKESAGQGARAARLVGDGSAARVEKPGSTATDARVEKSASTAMDARAAIPASDVTKARAEPLGECPECARRRVAKAAAMKRWRGKKGSGR